VSKNLSKILFSKMAEHPKVKDKVTIPSLRVAISRERSRNPGVTLNAAAFLYAKKKTFSVLRYLDDEDRRSLQFAKTKEVVEKPRHRARQVKHRISEPSFGSVYVKDAIANARVYPYFYILENSLRDIILEEFKTVGNWWSNTSYVRKDIPEYAQRIQNAERNYPWVKKRGNHPIYYVGLEELHRIITKNWTRFERIFKDQGNLRTWFNELIPVRHLVAHNIKASREERKNIEIRAKFICTLIENAEKP